MFIHSSLLILAGFVLDTIIGDPETKYHPIRFVGLLIKKSEKLLYHFSSSKRLNGIFLVLITLIITLGIGLEIEKLLFSLQPLFGYVWDVLIFYFGLAFRSLLDAGTQIKKLIKEGDLAEARKKLSFIVSRDTENLSEKDIIRGTIESLSENLSDAIIAPLFYAFLFGIAGIIAYKTINTLDSMIGYKTDRYLKFGWFAARLDDVVNWIPARIAFLLVLLASVLLRYDVISCWKTVWRYSQTGASPNGGIGICAFAGALGVQLGGTNYFHGEVSETPTVGEKKKELTVESIKQSQRLIIASTLLGLLIAIII